MTEKKNELLELLKKNAIAILLSGALLLWGIVKDTFNAGAELKFRSEITGIVKEDLKVHFDTIIDNRFQYNLEKCLKDPTLFLDVLSSPFVSSYAEDKALEIHREVESKLLAMDSIQTSFVTSIGKNLGVRDEDVMPLFKNMMRDYIKKKGIDKVTAAF